MRPRKKIEDVRVLLVDDNPVDRLLERALLLDFGFRRIHEAEDGSQAFFKLQNMNFDLIITDWQMPIVSGFDLLRKIRNNRALSKIPIIFLTGLADKKGV